jgi:hypothetical protein
VKEILYASATLPCDATAMRKMLILASGAMAFGLAGGYAWSALTAPAARAPAPRKAATVALPQSP